MGHECSDCTFVASKEAIYVDPKVFRNATVRPNFIGFFTLPGWRGHISFYVFRCSKCGKVSWDYPHGYTNFGLLYFICGICEEILPLKVRQNRGIYKREEVPLPPPTLGERIREFEKVTPRDKPTVIVIGRKMSWSKKIQSFLGL